MALVTEHLNGGLVSARDPIELVPGELQQANECIYRLHDSAIYGRPGVKQYNTTTIKDSTGATCPVKGLAHLVFENSRTDQFLALGGNSNSTGTLWYGDFTAIDGSALFSRLTGPGQVTDASINNSTTMTSASNGFANMVQGARVTGTGIPANTTVVTVVSSSNITLSNATTGGAQVVTATFDMGIAVTPDDTGAEILQVVYWGGAYYATFAHGVMRRIYFKGRSISTASLTDILVGRPAGMEPVTVQPTVTVVAGAWSAVLGNGYYWFLVTESYNPGQPDAVEGTYTPVDDKGKKLGPVPAHITDFTSQCVQITHNARANDGSDTASGRISTHWNVYMSPKQDDNINTPSLGTFHLVATFPIYQSNGSVLLTQTLQDASTLRKGYPTAVAAIAGRNQFTNAANMIGAPDNQIARGKSGSSTSGSEADVPMNRLQSYGFSGADGTFAALTVTGISVLVTGMADPSGNAGRTAVYAIYLTTTGGKNSGPIFGQFGSKSLHLNYHGGQYDTEGVAWVPGDFAVGGGFEVWMEKAGGGSRQRLGIDSVQVVVFYTGTSVNLNGPAFRIITYRDQIGFTVDDPARLPPPESSTCDYFQGSIVSNDLAQGSTIRWTLPGEPEAWPKPYFLTFSGEKNFTITCIRALNQVLIVGMRDAVQRVNYLPSETDTDFHEGIAHETIAGDHGIVGPLAAVTFTRQIPPYAMSYMRYGAGTHLVYVSYSAIHITDGVTSSFLNTDIRLSDYIDPNFIQNCILRNYAKEQWIVLFYTPVGGTKNTKALIFPYGEPKQDGTLRAIGPISVSARSACTATLNGVPLLFTGHDFGGAIWTEDQGNDLTGYTLDGATQLVASPSIITRRFYPAGIDRNARTERQYVQNSAAGTQTSLSTVVMTAKSLTITRAAGWAGIVKGMRIVHTNIPGDTIVTNVSGTTITMSQAAFETVTDIVIFDTGTVSVTLRAQSVGTGIVNVGTTYSSTFTGGLLSTAQDAHAQAFDMMIEKVRMPDNSLVDLNTAFVLQHFTYDIADAGKEQTRSGVV